ncbi:unnamed protein product [Durusdinium trenchii]|uniref:Uncharacterized protein n=1 Tax=Durusdinium trenchii TaxID=1381693 RepID=A0ABP0HVP3_9DINO
MRATRGHVSPNKGLAAGYAEDDAAERAADQLSAWDANTRRFALQSLGLLGPKASDHLPEMAKLLEDEEPEVRKAAAQACGRVGGGARDLAMALKDAEAAVRSEAATALGRLGSQAKPQLERIVALAKDPDQDAAAAAVTCLANIGEAQALAAFMDSLSLVSRAYFLRVLGRFGDFEVLLDAYGSSSTSIDVAHFLEWLKPEVPPQLQASAASAASASALVEDLARRSVTLRTLLKFLRSLPKTMPHFNVERTRTVDVVWQVIIPETATRGCSYAELLESERRLPDKMISHNWGNLFAHLMAAVFADAAGKPSFSAILSWLQLGAKGLDMIEALIEDAGQLDSTRWLCIFAVNQHISICDSTWGCRDSVTNVPFTGCGCKRRKFHSGPRCEMDKFDAMITLFKQKKPGYEHILAVDSQVGLLNRIWVVAEVAEVFRQELPCKVVLHQPSSDLEEKTMALNVWTAEASRPEDVSMILDKIEDKDVFNERTKAALLAVGYLASLEAHVEMRYHLRGISSAEADAAFLRTVDACRAKLRQLRASQSEVLEIWRSFNEDEKIGSSDRDTKAMIALVNMIRECDLMLPECFIKTYREAAFPEGSS